jgi:N-acetylmuramoyl-L-alanine amidase/type II secretory pathway predicted ATPase ExeA
MEVASMFLEFFNLRQQPFGVTPDPAYLFPSRTHCEALDALTDGILDGRGFLALIAEPGMGKTTLLYQVLEGMREKARGAYLFQTQCDSREFFQYLLSELGVDASGMGLVAMHNKLNEMLFAEMLDGKRFVLIVDEAQNLDDSVLETIRLLSNFETSNTKLLQIVLAGQPQLADKLDQPHHCQLLQRITVVQHLEPFSPEETAGYIRHRVKVGGNSEDEIFEQDALALIAAQSRGVPRNINRICYNALLEAHALGSRTVTPEIVERANRKLAILAPAPPAQASAPASAPQPANADAAQAAAAGAAAFPAPTPLTYKAPSRLRPRGRIFWTGGLTAILLAGAVFIPPSLRGDLLHSVRGRMASAFASLAIHRARLGTDRAAAVPTSAAQLREVDASERDPLAALQPLQHGEPIVASIQASSGQADARVVVLLNSAVRFESARISSPDRIYFDLHNVRLSPAVTERILPGDNGLLKWVRAAQNTDDVVRLVLDAGSAKYYSAQLLSDPYRLVIDVHAQPVAAAAVNAGGASANVPQPSASAAAVVASATVSDTARSLAHALGLKINRIAIDPGHGGSDTGAMGPHGLLEKDLCLDVALRLGQLIESNISGAEVVYTRKDDTYIPLERRTDIANNANADLFISIHANSSDIHNVRGVETYYLNLSSSPESMQLATRENAMGLAALHDLPDLLQKIARNEKTSESKQLADEIQDALSSRLQLVSRGETNRGVKRAPFLVLTGAKMPAILSEISFVSNARDESLLLEAAQRQRVAEGLYRGIAAYLDNLNSAPSRRDKLVSENRQHVGGMGTAEGRNAAKTP